MKKGVSLLILVITVVVLAILTTAIVLNVETNNTIKNAADATLLEDIANFKEQLKMVTANKIMKKELKNLKDVNAKEFAEIQEFIPDFPVKYNGKFIIVEGELCAVKDKLVEGELKAIQDSKVTKIIGLTETINNIPKGFTKINEDPLIIQKDTPDKTQYIWIKIDNIENLKQKDYNQGVSVTKDLNDGMTSETYNSIKKYKGYYMAKNEIYLGEVSAEDLRKHVENLIMNYDCKTILPSGSMYDQLLKHDLDGYEFTIHNELTAENIDGKVIFRNGKLKRDAMFPAEKNTAYSVRPALILL